MWFEILPSFGIVLAALTIPHIANYWVNRGITGRVSFDHKCIHKFVNLSRLLTFKTFILFLLKLRL